MTKPTPPTSRTGDHRFARDVAKHLDRRRTRRKLVLWALILVLLAAAARYLGWGHGFGLGLGGQGEGSGPGSTHALVGHRRCAIRVAASGITVDGKPMQRDEAVAACKATTGADVVVTGADVVVTGAARQGNWDDLRSALDAAGVATFLRDQPPTGSASR